MRSLRWLPLAYFADIHGFALFAPYAALVVTIYHVNYWLRRRASQRPSLIPTPIGI